MQQIETENRLYLTTKNSPGREMLESSKQFTALCVLLAVLVGAAFVVGERFSAVI